MFFKFRTIKTFSATVMAALIALSSIAYADSFRGRDWDRGGHGRDWRGNDDRRDRGWNRGWDRHYDRHRDYNRHRHSSSRVIIKPYAGFSFYSPRSSFYGSYYHPHRNYGYRNWTYNRRYGRRHSGFGFYYSDNDALRFLGLTALGLVIFNELSEAQQRAHENAMVRATTISPGEPIRWNQGSHSGTVVVTRQGQTTEGRPCREFQQEIIVGGQREQGYGTACMQPDGAWKMVN